MNELLAHWSLGCGLFSFSEHLVVPTDKVWSELVSGRLFIRQDEVSGHFQGNTWGNGPKCGKLLYPCHLQKWFDFDQYWLNFNPLVCQNLSEIEVLGDFNVLYSFYFFTVNPLRTIQDSILKLAGFFARVKTGKCRVEAGMSQCLNLTEQMDTSCGTQQWQCCIEHRRW